MQLRYGIATSLDGYIAPPDESTGWIVEDSAIDFEAMYASFDVFIMGRKTYEIITADPDNNPLSGHPRGTVIVISRTLSPTDHPDITIMSQGYIDHIREIKKREGRMWLMGGGWLAAECLEAGLLDAIDAGIMPVLLGSGFKLISDGTRPGGSNYKLALRSLDKLQSGILMAEYDVVYTQEQRNVASK